MKTSIPLVLLAWNASNQLLFHRSLNNGWWLNLLHQEEKMPSRLFWEISACPPAAGRVFASSWKRCVRAGWRWIFRHDNLPNHTPRPVLALFAKLETNFNFSFSSESISDVGASCLAFLPLLDSSIHPVPRPVSRQRSFLLKSLSHVTQQMWGVRCTVFSSSLTPHPLWAEEEVFIKLFFFKLSTKVWHL